MEVGKNWGLPHHCGIQLQIFACVISLVTEVTITALIELDILAYASPIQVLNLSTTVEF